jgi:NitT/TauT family transport system ATP-binding protein
MPLVRVRDVSRVFANGVQALGGASLDIEAGEFLSVLGPSGCGKSTLLRLIAGLAEPSAGTIEWPQGKPDLGFVFQEPTLMPWTTVCRTPNASRVRPRRSQVWGSRASRRAIRVNCPAA